MATESIEKISDEKNNIENKASTKFDGIDIFLAVLYLGYPILTMLCFAVTIFVDADFLPISIIIGVVAFLLFLISVTILKNKGLKDKKRKSIYVLNVVLTILTIVGVILLFCMDGYNSYDDYNSNNSYSSYNSDKVYGAGGYEMPNENDDSFSDYVQRVDPDLYDSMQDQYDYYNSGSNSYDSSYNSDKEYGAGGYEMPNENDKSFSDYVQRVDPDLYDSMQEQYDYYY